MSLVKVCNILLIIVLAGCGVSKADANTLADNGNKTVTDSKTGLIWQQEEPGAMIWGNALTYCDGLTLGGADDWRLPNVKELESLADDTLYNPSIDKTYFPNAVSSWYWSSTTDAYLSFAWFVNFYYGSNYFVNKSDSYYVRCVRGGQSEPFGSLNISPLSNNFGSVATNTTSTAQTFTLSNSGPGNLAVSTITLTGADSGMFTLVVGSGTSGTCGASPTIAPAGSCTVSTTFTPASAGTKSTTLQITSDDQVNPTKDIALTGTGEAAAPTTYTIGTSVTGGNGTITCDTPITSGGTSNCTISNITAGYHLATFTDNSVNKLASVIGNAYTITNVTADHTVAGTFVANSIDTSTTLAAPILGSKTNLTITIADSTTSFADVDGVQNSNIQLASDSGFSSIVSSKTGLTGGVFTGLTGNTTYYVRIIGQAKNNSTGSWEDKVTPTLVVVTSASVTTPSAFTFVDQSDVPLNTLITSAPITVAGINAPSAISVTGGTYSVNGGEFISTSGFVNAGDTVRVQHTSSTGNSASMNTLLTIGGIQDTFSTITAALSLTYTVTPFAGTGNIIFPDTPQTVSSGSTTTFAILSNAAPGYGIFVSGCNGTINRSAIPYTYTTGAITGNCSVSVVNVRRGGFSVSGTEPIIADALKALQAYSGMITMTAEELIRYDVAPMAANGVPTGNGVVDLADVIMILRRTVGIGNW